MAKTPPKKKVSGGKSTQIKAETKEEVKAKHNSRPGDAAWQFHENPAKKPHMLVGQEQIGFPKGIFTWRSESKKRQATMDKVWAAVQAVGRNGKSKGKKK